MNLPACRYAALLLALAWMPTIRAEAQTPPPLPTIIAGVIARDEATQKLLQTMQYDQSEHTEQVGDKSHPAKQQDVKMIIRPGAPQEVEVISTRGDDLPSDPDQAAAKAKGNEVQRRKTNLSLKDLVTRFNISFRGMTVVSGQKAYLLGFEPKPNQPYHTQTEKVLNELHGQIVVRASDDIILKTDATLAKSVEVAWFLASIESLDFHYELRSTTDIFGPAWLETSVDVKTLLFSIKQRQTIDMTNFRPRGSR